MTGDVAVFPCSSSQTRLWLLEQLDRGGRALTVQAPLRLEGPVDHQHVKDALRALISRHESLRTTFSELDGQPVQRVHPSPGLAVGLPVTDLANAAPLHRATTAAAVARALVAEPFDLVRGPLVRAHLVRTGQSAVLFLAFHHIVVDGWSVRTIHDELRALLAAAQRGEVADLPDLRVQYSDFALWQRRRLLEGYYTDHLKWWEELLADTPDESALFGAGPPAEHGSTGARLECVVDPATVDRVRTLATARGATPFAVLLAAFATALRNRTGRSDLVIGAPVAGRSHAELEPVVGFFVNTLPLRVRVTPGPFGNLVEAIRELANEAFDRQDVPYEEIARRAGRPDRPLFDVMFNFLEGRALPQANRTGAGVEASTGPQPTNAHSDLELYVLDSGDRLRLELVYATGRVDEEAARELLAAILAALTAPQTLLAATPEPPRPVAIAGPPREWPADRPEQTLVGRFLDVARAHPHRVAVAEIGWDYAELSARALGIGAAVRGSGAPHERVGVLTGHGGPGAAAVLGVLCAGSAYVPLDRHSPAARLAEIADDAGLALVLVDDAGRERRSELTALRPDLTWLDVGTISPSCAEPASATAGDGAGPDAPAYVLYTSGTTGTPKGVVQSHRHVLALAHTYAEALDLRPGDVLSMVAGIGTDAAVMDLFGALLTGACLHPVDLHDVGLDELPGVVAAASISVLHTTPTVFRSLAAQLDGAAQDGAAPTDPPLGGLRLLVLGGEAATRGDLAAFGRHASWSAVLVNGYGPTESTLAMQFFADRSTAVASEALPLGLPVAGMSVSVQDDAGSPVPAGGVGEIVLTGPHLALGYWRRRAETERAFGEPDEPEPRSYRTGDLARVHPDGTLTFAGRTDGQIKVRGFRVEPAEIETALRREPGVLAAAVTASSPLTAHLVLADGVALTPAGLRRALRRSLPDYMIPAQYLVVDALPLTPSGKVDRRAASLTADARPLQSRPTGEQSPRDPVQISVADVWAEVLEVDRSEISLSDTFFDFGGHSLLLTQVAARLAERLGVRVALRELFANPTLGDLAARVGADVAGGGSPDPAREPIPARTGPGPYPLSSAQARLWFLDELSPGRSTYTMSLALPIPAGTGLGDVQAALDELVARHDSLRTTFDVVDGQPLQRIGASVAVRVVATDLSGLEPAVAAEQRDAVARTLAATSFDLRRGPLVRAHLVDLGVAGQTLCLALHHIVADGWSLRLLRREFTLLLAAINDGRGSPLAAPPLRYADYAVWERTRSGSLSDALAWWAGTLAGAPELLDLPADRPRPAAPSFAGSLAAQGFDADLAGRCRRLARRHGATPFMVYLTAFATVLHRWSGERDLVIGTPVAGRTRVETEQVVGLFVNSLPLRLTLGGDPSLEAFLGIVRETVTAAQEHQEVPFEEIVRRVAPQRRLAHAPLFQVMFAVGSAQPEDGEGPTGEVAHTATAKFDLSMTVDDGAAPTVYLEYATDLFDAPAAHHLLRATIQVLTGLTTTPTRPLSQVPLSAPPSPAEVVPPRRGRTLGRSTSARGYYLGGSSGGAGLAVVGDGEAMTYRELAAATGSVAGRLRALGVRPGVVVGLDMARGPDLIATLLAVHAVGAAFVLLEPRLPAARRADLLARSGARLVIGPELLWGLGSSQRGEPDQSSALDPGCAAELEGDLPAYVVPTSGSTGRPKLVVVPRRALEAQVSALVDAYGLTSADRVLQFASLGFDVAVEEIWPTIAVGATLDLGPAHGPPSFAELAELCGPGGVTVLNLPASYWHEWVAYLGAGGQEVPARLRLVIVGSEPVRPQAVARWHALAPKARLLCAYGTSETTITNAVYEPSRDRDWAAEQRVPIGAPLPSGRLVVLDPGGRPVPPGTLGELAVEGSCVADGYLGQPALTSRRFVFGPTGRRYLTGDRARERFDGTFDVVGRLDDQLKLAGHRIEPGEVEAALMRRPGVGAAAVALRGGPDGHPRLVAYVVAAGAAVPDGGELRAALLRELPEALVPSAYVTLAALPRTVGGKLDRALLPEPPTVVTTPTGPPPRTATERAVAEVWAETLHAPLDAVSAASNFFELGGDSILSLQVAWRLGSRGIPVSLADLFEHQSVRELAEAITAGLTSAGGASDAPSSVAALGPIPLTPIQRWQLEAASPAPSHDNQAVLLRLAASVTGAELHAALHAVVTAHDALRSRFERRDGDWQAWTVDPDAAGVPLTLHDPDADLAAVAAFSHASLDLAAGPLLRADVLPAHRVDGAALPGEESRLLLVAHHLVVDVVSWQIILDDLETALRQATAGDVPRLSSASASWGTWARRLTEWAQGEEAGEQARWWLEHAGAGSEPGADRVLLPTAAHGPPGGVAGEERVLRVGLGAPATGRLLRSMPSALGARIDEAIVAALAIGLTDGAGLAGAADVPRSGRRTVLLDVEGHGREPLFADADVSRTVGWLTTLRPVELAVRPAESVLDTLLGARDLMRAMPRHGIARGAVAYLRPADDPLAAALRAQPAPQVSVNYLGQLGSARPVAGLLNPGGPAPGPARSPLAPRPYALDVVAAVRDDELVLWLSYSPAVQDRSVVQALAERCTDLLTQIADACDTARPADRTPPSPEETEPVARYPLTPMQEAMIYGAGTGRGSGVYVEHTVLMLPPTTDHDQLRAAWEHLVPRHDILRTRFVEDPGGARRQEVTSRADLPWRVVDWRHLPVEEARGRLDGLLEEDRRRGFAIDRAPLMRLALVHLPDGARLVWSHHHALLDGWSAALLLEDLDTVARALAAGRRPPEPAQRPFRDYLTWLADRSLARDEDYWTRELADLPERGTLPVHDVGPGLPRAAALAVSPPREVRRALTRQARVLRVGPAVLAHAAWALVLGAYTQSGEVLFGVTASGRPAELSGAGEMVGLLITTHPSRVPLPASTPLTTWIAGLAARELTRREHAHAGPVRIARWGGTEPGTALFESLFVVENYGSRPGGTETLDQDTSVREVPVREIPDVPLSVVVGRDLGLKIVYDARRFERSWIADLLGALQTALRGIADASAESTVGDLDVLGPAVRRRLLTEWNDTYRPLPRASLGEQWAAAAVRHGDEVAVCGTEGHLTYAELARAADRVSARLRALGARRGDLVGIAADRSAELVAAVLGIVQAGCAYVPLDPAYPDERLGLLVADTAMRLVVAREELLGRLPDAVRPGAVVIDGVLDADWARPADRAPEPGAESEPIGDDAPAYVIYTSGSTGRPKGVVVPHRAVTRLVVGSDYCPLRPGDAVALASTFSFDASTFELWGALLSGARLVPLDGETLLSPRLLGAALETRGVTTLFLTTAAFNAVATEVPAAFAPLTTLLFGGERVDPERVRDVLRAGPPRRLLHVYGPTETTTFAAWHQVREVADGASTIPIGRPIANTELLVLDAELALVPPGVEGELYIGGPGLALGYLGDPELTSRRFVAHPLRAGARLYATGDVVLQRGDGTIEIRGRRDGQVKIRGFRIEPGEVEAHLARAPGVAAAVVMARRESSEVHFLAAYAVPARGARLDPAELLDYLRTRLPEHLVPTTVTVLDTLPLNPNGKVDRAKLPDPRPLDVAGPIGGATTDTELAVARIWARVLHVEVDALRPSHDFFALGGHSLLLTQVAAHLRADLEVDLPLRVLFEVRSLGALAALAAGWERTAATSIPVADRAEYRGTVDERGHLLVAAALRERLRSED